MKALSFTIVLILAALSVSAQTLDSLDAALTKIDQQRNLVMREYDREKKQNEERRRRIEQGSASERDVRDAYTSAAKLDQMNVKLNELGSHRHRLCVQWRTLYRSRMDSLLASAEKETDRKKKAESGRQLHKLQARNEALCPENVAVDPLQWKALQIETYDGPQEITQKAQLLKDIARVMTLRLASLDDRYQQALKERRTRERAQEFIQEGTLFDQTVSIRAPGSASADTGSSTALSQPTLEIGSDSAATPPPAGPSAGSDVGQDWRISDNPNLAAEDYRKKRAALLQQRKELEAKIREFEEKVESLLRP